MGGQSPSEVPAPLRPLPSRQALGRLPKLSSLPLRVPVSPCLCSPPGAHHPLCQRGASGSPCSWREGPVRCGPGVYGGTECLSLWHHLSSPLSLLWCFTLHTCTHTYTHRHTHTHMPSSPEVLEKAPGRGTLQRRGGDGRTGIIQRPELRPPPPGGQQSAAAVRLPSGAVTCVPSVLETERRRGGTTGSARALWVHVYEQMSESPGKGRNEPSLGRTRGPARPH